MKRIAVVIHLLLLLTVLPAWSIPPNPPATLPQTDSTIATSPGAVPHLSRADIQRLLSQAQKQAHPLPAPALRTKSVESSSEQIIRDSFDDSRLDRELWELNTQAMDLQEVDGRLSMEGFATANQQAAAVAVLRRSLLGKRHDLTAEVEVSSFLGYGESYCQFTMNQSNNDSTLGLINSGSQRLLFFQHMDEDGYNARVFLLPLAEWSGNERVVVLGTCSSPACNGDTSVTLPVMQLGRRYQIRAVSTLGPTLWAASPDFSDEPNAVPEPFWACYE